ncbi:unnamed protein product [Musa textilis]
MGIFEKTTALVAEERRQPSREQLMQRQDMDLSPTNPWLTLISVAETLFFLCSLSRPIPSLSRKHIPEMGYGRLGSSESVPSVSELRPGRDASATRKRRFLWLGVVFAVFLLVASGVSVGLVVSGRMRSNSPATRAPTQAIARACSLTRYPALCVSSLLDFPGALQAGERDLVHISLNMTLHRMGAALYGTSAIAGFAMDRLARAAFDDCMELLEESLDQLSDSLLVVAPPASPSPSSQARIRGASDEDVLTWLSGALTNQDTCDEGLQQVQNLYIKEHMESHMKDLAELVSNCLAIFAGVSRNKDLLRRSHPEQEATERHRRRRRIPVMDGEEGQEAATDSGSDHSGRHGGFEGWERHLQVHRGRCEGRAGLQQPPHHYLHQGRPVRGEHQGWKEEDEPPVRRRW